MMTNTISEDVILGKNVMIYDYVNLYGCSIGDNTSIGTFVEIQKNAQIGKNCKISSHTFICEGVVIEDNVFIGHNVTFINDLYPRAANKDGQKQNSLDWTCIPTLVQKGASIGSSATLLCGVMVGKNAIIGAGSMVTRNVLPNTVVAGNPAKFLKKLKPTNMNWRDRFKDLFKKYFDLSVWILFKVNGKTKI